MTAVGDLLSLFPATAGVGMLLTTFAPLLGGDGESEIDKLSKKIDEGFAEIKDL